MKLLSFRVQVIVAIRLIVITYSIIYAKVPEDRAVSDEPPIVPVLRQRDNHKTTANSTGNAVERKTPLTKDDIQKMNLKKKTRKRTRKFVIDGVVVTTTTSKVIYGDEDNERFYDDHYFRKQVILITHRHEQSLSISVNFPC